MESNIDYSWEDNPVDVSTEVNFIWQVATLLHGVSYKDADHRDVILPMTILRRLEGALEPTRQKVTDYESSHPGTPDRKLERLAEQKFFNRSPWTLAKLLDVKSGQAQDLKDYIAGFSTNVKDIFAALKFDQQIDEMQKKDVLHGVIKYFTEIDLSPRTVDSIKMGYIFEDLMRKFYESAEAGKQYTGRDIVRLLVSILMSEGADDIYEPGKVITALDQACGTGGMLSSTYSFIKHHNPEAQVFLYGQEYDEAAHAICVAEMLIKGQDPENIRCVDSLREDCFPNQKMRFLIENPPFGTAWGGDKLEKREADVKAENRPGGRYPAGLPGTGDSQLLFVQSAVDKMDDTCGRAAIIEHAGPLYTGDAGSGESEIRRWLLSRDLIEAIIALPTDLFYNTGLQTYVWVLSKSKAKHRKGKVQLIDASSFCHPLRKKLGDKKNEITAEDRAKVTKLYTDFKPNEFVKIFDKDDFLYHEYTVMPPLQRRYEITEEKIQDLIGGGYLSSLYNEKACAELEAKRAALPDGECLSAKDAKKLKKLQEGKPLYDALIATLGANVTDKVWYAPTSFFDHLAQLVGRGPCSAPLDRTLLEKIAKGLSTPDPKAEIRRDRKGEIIYDADLKDIEIVPYKETIDDYMAREVLPHLPGAKAFFLEDLTAKKPVIKTGAEFPFTRYFYKYLEPEPSAEIMKELVALDAEIAADFAALKGEVR